MSLVASILSFPTCLGVKARPFPSNSGGATLCCCTRLHSERKGSSVTCQCVTRHGPLMLWGITHRIAYGATASCSGYNCWIKLLFESMFLVALPG